ncbi:right-handed parallel beta-helix repeat-containing protein [Cohnella luojiensis]|uniref:Right-handed parallel beta-helix repeat-containing protein n=1 Tax=Cohnella luojiensis TaxID=652876 RepID=A0A4Y8LZR9_9BACL|nr:right-handed parallel beta-helix repeat-containing protein [Cohnella luojiensis]TFE25557.1 right-handed parallel beta-helix repeat-containing protein [Cohnella luojiensis]
MNATSETKGMEPVVLRLSDYGAEPDTGTDAAGAMRRAIEAASRIAGPVHLVCDKGRYDFYSQSAAKAPYYITNTTSETENADPTKTIGIYLKGMSDFTLDGGGALFVFHGKHTLFVIDECERIAVRDLHTDYAEPTVVEMTVELLGSGWLDVKVHPDSRYQLEDGKLHWTGEGWRFHGGPMQACDPVRNTTWRIDNLIERAIKVEELPFGRLRLFFDDLPDVAEGYVLQARDGIRDQVGAFVNRSRDVRMDQVGIHFMHGLGIVGQFSEDLAFNRLDLSPRPETGRTVAAFADFVHLSGCRGKVSITGGRFVGAHDDVINVHGTHLKIVGSPTPNQLVIRFMHPQTYGFEAFFPGDEIEMIRARSLTPYSRNRVTEAMLIGPREMLLTLEERNPDVIEEDDVIENVTWTPEVEITDNYFARIPTRGVLVTTRRRAVIARNVFERMQMSAILAANDAASWYESGRVEDLTVHGNRFIDCGSRELPVIAIVPENEEIDSEHPVHRNIRIENNSFTTSGALVLDAKSTRSLTFRGNEVFTSPGADGFANVREAIRLTACSEVDIEANRFIPVE